MRALAAILALAIAAMPGCPALAQTFRPAAEADAAATPLDRRIEQLSALFTGGGDFDASFTEPFRAQVPEPRWRALAAQVVAAIGAPTGVEERTPAGPNGATLRYGFERGIATIRIAVEPDGAGRIAGLLIVNTEPRGDTAARIAADVAGLPGTAGLIVRRLDGGTTAPVIDQAGDRAGPIGSAFKLWVLAEAVRQIDGGQRRWTDVLRLGERSLPSGVTQGWPPGSPATLHTLAVQMISISDNTATDTLMGALGRARVDAVPAALGVRDPDRTLPVLTTLEAFRLKALSRQGAVPAGWDALTPDARRRWIAQQSGALRAAVVTASLFNDGPVRTDIEWVASPADMARTLDWFRRRANAEAMAILAVNPGTAIADRFDWVGFKGGSEPGVLSLNYLVRTKSGHWFAVTGQWHNATDGVDEARFMAIINRALTLISRPVQP
jgi:beta-lactamase class A